MQAEGKAIELVPEALGPPPKGLVVREEGAKEPLGPSVYRNAMSQSSSTLVAEWRWSALSPSYMLSGLGLSWAALLAGFYGFAPTGLPAWLLGLTLVFIVYYALAIVVNRAELRVNDDALILRHGPLPWPGRRLASGGLRGLFCRPEARVMGDENDAHELWALQRDGSQHPLAHGLTPDGARFLERLVEARLVEARVERGERG